MNQSRMNRLREEGGRISVTLPPRLARAAIAEMERLGLRSVGAGAAALIAQLLEVRAAGAPKSHT